MKALWAAPLAMLYGLVVWIRHKMFDAGWLRSQEYDIPIISVGNLTVGGTGKTPVTEMLVGRLSPYFRIAVLSRGYKRKSKGYIEVKTNTRTLMAGDEPKQIKLKFPDTIVAVCAKRTEGIDRIRKEHPDVEVIILDDGFQHRYVKPWIDILLIDYNRPIFRDHMLPWGRLRDRKSQMHRAAFVVVTKCPHDITPLDRRLFRKSLTLYPYQNLYFTKMDLAPLRPVFPEHAPSSPQAGATVVAMSGIANPAAFRDTLATSYKVVDQLVYPDHHIYRRRDIPVIEKLLNDSPQGSIIVTTEKDMVKLSGAKKMPDHIKRRLYYQPISVSFFDDSERDFQNRLNYDLRTNPEHRVLRS